MKTETLPAGEVLCTLPIREIIQKLDLPGPPLKILLSFPNQEIRITCIDRRKK